MRFLKKLFYISIFIFITIGFIFIFLGRYENRSHLKNIQSVIGVKSHCCDIIGKNFIPLENWIYISGPLTKMKSIHMLYGVIPFYVGGEKKISIYFDVNENSHVEIYDGYNYRKNGCASNPCEILNLKNTILYISKYHQKRNVDDIFEYSNLPLPYSDWVIDFPEYNIAMIYKCNGSNDKCYANSLPMMVQILKNTKTKNI